MTPTDKNYIDKDKLELTALEYMRFFKGEGGNPEPFGAMLMQLHDNIL